MLQKCRAALGKLVVRAAYLNVCNGASGHAERERERGGGKRATERKQERLLRQPIGKCSCCPMKFRLQQPFTFVCLLQVCVCVYLCALLCLCMRLCVCVCACLLSALFVTAPFCPFSRRLHKLHRQTRSWRRVLTVFN